MHIFIRFDMTIEQLFHLLESQPLRSWEPSPAPRREVGGDGGREGGRDAVVTHAPLTCVRFSPCRPTVFAASSGSGYVFLFDLASSSSSHVLTLSTPSSPVGDDNADGGRGGGWEGKCGGLTAVAFNGKIREFVAACDSLGAFNDII